jgi:hypothetical protein
MSRDLSPDPSGFPMSRKVRRGASSAHTAAVPVPVPINLDARLGRIAAVAPPDLWHQLVAGCVDLLRHAERLARLEQLCAWALSSTPALRRLTAAVLADDVLQVGAGSILDFLSRDPDPEVRAQALRIRRSCMRGCHDR